MNSLIKKCLLVCAAIGLSTSHVWIHTLRAEELPRIRKDVVYGHKDGMALTMDVFEPEANRMDRFDVHGQWRLGLDLDASGSNVELFQTAIG